MRALLPLLIVFALAACTPPAQPAGSSQRLAESQKLTIGLTSLAPTLDPHLSTTGTVRKYEIFETLVLQDDSGRAVEPLLATRWEAVTPTTWRFTLRSDARFQDGERLTAEDVAFSWRRLSDPALRSPIRGNVHTVADIRALDPTTVEIETRSPDPLLLKRLTLFAVTPKAYLERVGAEGFAAAPIGSGPFRLVEFRPDDRLVLVGWKEHPYRRPTLEQVTVRAIPDTTARAQGLRLGELDIAQLLSLESVEALRREGFQVDVRSDAIYAALLDTWGSDGTNVGPIADRRVRQALNYAVDRVALGKSLYRGLVEPAGWMTPPGVVGFNPELRPYGYDLARARSLLAEAGYGDGFSITLEYSATLAEMRDLAQYLQAQFKELKIDLTIAPVPAAEFVDKIYKRKPIAPLYLGGRSAAPFLDADTVIVWHWSESPFGKRFTNADFDRLYVASTRELDPARREALLREAVAVLHEDPPLLALTTTALVSGAAPTVAGITKRVPDSGWNLLDRLSRTR